MRPYLLAIALLAACALSGQVAAPDLICTRTESGDEVLTWSNAANDCGPYLGTEIYRADAVAGPYTLLATLTDATATEYRDPNPNGTQLFYFLQYAYDCPADSVITSDTLDSFIPVTPRINFVSVVDGNLIVSWRPSPSPEVNRYVILEVTDTGVIPLDTVGLDTTYTITGLPPGDLTNRSYRVAALDACGNDSPQSDIVSAIELSGSGGAGCEAVVELIPLEPVLTSFLLVTPDSAEVLSLYVSVNGGPFGFYESWTEPVYVDSVVSGYPYSGANDGDSLCFYIEVDYPDLALNRRSVTYCQTVNISQPVRDFPLYGVEVTDAGRLVFEYEYPSVPPPTYSYALEQRSGGTTLVFADEVDSLLSYTGVITNNPIPTAPQDSFRFALVDDCNREAYSNYVTPVFLAAQPVGLDQAMLQWTPLENGLPGTITYTVYRVQPDSTLDLLVTGLNDLNYTDDDPDAGSVRCFRVEAVYQTADSTAAYTFLSNIACVASETQVYLPNVFNPNAARDENRIFLPRFNNVVGINDYRLQVYDRWGGLVFESEDPQTGWTGDFKGRKAPSGTYIYILTFTSPRGNLVESSGVVHVLY